MRAISMSGSMRGVWKREVRLSLLTRRRTKRAAEMLNLTPPRHTPALPTPAVELFEANIVRHVELTSSFFR